jgi:hypothetical protein
MDLQAEKNRLFTGVVNERITDDKFMVFAKAIGTGVTDDVLEKWRKRFYAKCAMDFPTNPRLLNHFKVGADPEFVFNDVANGRNRIGGGYVHAQLMGMTTLEAFGADMNGRLAELRAFPSTFVLEVVASLMDTLRWMPVFYPDVLNYQWIAPAFFGQDGVGGHVHLGRKKQDGEATVKNLDMLVKVLVGLNCVDAEGQNARLAHTAYGRPGDIRPQEHGYEYRTMPTWMASPWSAYLALTLAKLCVFHPLSDAQLHREKTYNGHILKNLLLKFQNDDDDARIALIAWNKWGLPNYGPTDMKANWGVKTLFAASDDLVSNNNRAHRYIPPVIQASDTSVRELFAYLTTGTALPKLVPQPTWSPYHLEKTTYKPWYEAHRPGFPEFLQGVLSKDLKFKFYAARDRKPMVEFVYCSKYSFPWSKIKEAFDGIGLTVKRDEWSMSDRQPEDGITTVKVFMPDLALRNGSFEVNKALVSKLRTVFFDSGLFPLTKFYGIKSLDTKQFLEKKKDPVLYGKCVQQWVGKGAR